MKTGNQELHWICHTTHLFDEILTNPDCAILRKPLIILRGLLADVAQRCIELNDDKLNLLMLRLTLYDCADPESKSYDPGIIKQFEQKLAQKERESK